ncbi:MAG: hypothetical protein GF375_06810 [Candidatus Omnitrophica bacterium]|nr:hypothetical protein [Candidatus Omnitrophota bacterium]MBD3269686.1 hypothetical protein [Candidatus Omnitrophota bacterium]
MRYRVSWQILLGIALVFLSIAVYFVHFLIFRDLHHILIYLVGDIAFVFLEVLLVTLIIHNLLSYREKRNLLNKLNMVIGTFFSEVGTPLLEMLSDLDENLSSAGSRLVIKTDWGNKEILEAGKYLKEYKPALNVRGEDFKKIKIFLEGKRFFLLNLLQNPNLLEHQSFTDLLWAIFHLTEESCKRKDLTRIPQPDLEHLRNDADRTYGRLIREWLNYMCHLHKNYPYLFSLAVRTNPFDENSSVQIS